MDRRTFITMVGGSIFAAPLVTDAQQAAKVPQIGYLAALPRSAPVFQQNRQAFLDGMRDHGYTEGQTIAIEWRFAEGRPERLPDLADELVRLKVNLIVAEATAASRAAKQATRTIPVVFIGAGFTTALREQNPDKIVGPLETFWRDHADFTPLIQDGVPTR